VSAPAKPPNRAAQRALLAWYRRHRRDLPWRRTRDPWRVWVSEVMLQQTRVAAATPYYERFVARFPGVRAFAAASLEEALASWAGLGYYRRARQLHEAARLVVREHAGRVPSDAAAFAALPGVGRYTLGAVHSISFDSPLPVLDGNVARVLARWLARPLQAKRPADAKVLWAEAAARVPAASPGDWNQALMELGATICTPRAPRCGACPVRAHCRAFALGTPEAFPPAAPRRAAERLRRAIVLIERRGHVLVTRLDGPLLAGLWEPPGADLAAGAGARRSLGGALRALGLRAALADTGVRVRHTITHRAIEVELWRGTLREPPPRRANLRWADAANRDVALSALARKAIGRRAG